MLTVDYDRLGARSGELVLDMGAGAGRHAFESLRRGTRIIALDYSHEELTSVRDLFWAMGEAEEIGDGGAALAVRGDALRLPFADDTFDRIICAEVLEHLTDDAGAIRELTRVLKPGGTIAVTVPSWLPEKLCWWLSAEYHAPLASGGHVRVYTEELLRSRLNDAGLEPGGSHRAHALHAPYWWLRCAVGPTNDHHPLVKAYHQVLVWDIAKAPFLTRFTERVLNPVLGKSVVVYSTKPRRTRKEGHRVAA
ncbi:MAG: class I SAM-dependent methyltransferase [Microthrixaceae bacterium]|nr:class I SAM-dependent methyltransferase [Microthrixaceae bacterium]